MLDVPYFMENAEWYEFDFLQRKYILTDKAPQDAQDSYKQYYQELNQMIVPE